MIQVLHSVGMSLNPTKSAILLWRENNHAQLENDVAQLKKHLIRCLNGSAIKAVTSAKVLGEIFDSKHQDATANVNRRHHLTETALAKALTLQIIGHGYDIKHREIITGD